MNDPQQAEPPGASSTFAERCWWAYHSLRPDYKGRLPSYRSLEIEHELPLAVLSKLLRGAIASVDQETLPRLAAALDVDPGWLLRGEGPAPVPSGSVPLRLPSAVAGGSSARSAARRGHSPLERAYGRTATRAEQAIAALELAVFAAKCFDHEDAAKDPVARGALWSTVLTHAGVLPKRLVISALELRDAAYISSEHVTDVAHAVMAWAEDTLAKLLADVAEEDREP